MLVRADEHAVSPGRPGAGSAPPAAGALCWPASAAISPPVRPSPNASWKRVISRPVSVVQKTISEDQATLSGAFFLSSSARPERRKCSIVRAEMVLARGRSQLTPGRGSITAQLTPCRFSSTTAASPTGPPRRSGPVSARAVRSGWTSGGDRPGVVGGIRRTGGRTRCACGDGEAGGDAGRRRGLGHGGALYRHRDTCGPDRFWSPERLRRLRPQAGRDLRPARRPARPRPGRKGAALRDDAAPACPAPRNKGGSAGKRGDGNPGEGVQ